MSSVRDPQVRGAVILGPAGAGRTCLLEACATLMAEQGHPLGRALPSRAASGIPFAALGPLLSPPRGEAVAPDENPLRVIRRTAEAWQRNSRRLVLLIDDAHLLDDASAVLVRQLAMSGLAFVVMTVHSGSAPPDALRALWKDGHAVRIDIGPLTRAEADELFAAILGGPVDQAVVEHLVAKSDGYVQTLLGYLDGAKESGTLFDDGGIWRLRAELTPPQPLIEIVESRLAGLAPKLRELLEVIAFGEPIGEAEATAVGDPGDFERLERQGLLHTARAHGRLQIGIAQNLIGDVLRSQIPAARLRSLAGLLAEAVAGEATPLSADDTIRIARCHLEAGGGDPELLLSAAVEARWRSDYGLATRFAQAAARKGAGFEAALLVAQLVGLQGRTVEAETRLEVLAAHATTDAERGPIAATRLDNQLWMGRSEHAYRIVQDAEKHITDPTWLTEIRTRLANLALGAEGPAKAIEIAEPLLATTSGGPLVHAHMILSRSLDLVGRLAEAADVAERGYQRQRTLARPLEQYAPDWHVFFRCEALAHAGRFAEAEQLGTAHYRAAVHEGSIEGQCCLAWFLSRTVADRGNIHEAEVYSRESIATFAQLGRPNLANWCTDHLALTLALAGKPAEAAAALSEENTGPSDPTLTHTVDRLHARAWVAAAEGDVPAARHHLHHAATAAQKQGNAVGEAAVLHTLARLGAAEEVVDRLAVLATIVEGDLVRARSAHARALAADDGDALAQVRDRFAGMRADLLAAEAAADAVVAWRRSGASRRAAAANAQLASLTDRCKGAVTPALLAASARVYLTPAERDIALLAAAGRSNKAIAAELHRSVRTVEAQLYSVYAKLGLSGRSELAAALESALTGKRDR